MLYLYNDPKTNKVGYMLIDITPLMTPNSSMQDRVICSNKLYLASKNGIPIEIK